MSNAQEPPKQHANTGKKCQLATPSSICLSRYLPKTGGGDCKCNDPAWRKEQIADHLRHYNYKGWTEKMMADNLFNTGYFAGLAKQA